MMNGMKNKLSRELCHSAIRDELYHHGILGMHWGERNGPPYPLNKEGRVRVLKSWIDDLNTWDYGVMHKGQKITDLSNFDFEKNYRTIPISKLKDSKIGLCWDFVNYQHYLCKKNGYKDSSYLMVLRRSNRADDVLTHTYSVVDVGSGDKYWIESAWYPERGVHKVSDGLDVAKYQASKEGNSGYAYDVYKYNPDGLDRGLTDAQFFNRAANPSNLVYTTRKPGTAPII